MFLVWCCWGWIMNFELYQILTRKEDPDLVMGNVGEKETEGRYYSSYCFDFREIMTYELLGMSVNFM